MYSLKSGKVITELTEINISNSKGNLRKWVAFIEGRRAYLKSSSVTNGRVWYECESECIVSRLAYTMGLKSVLLYYLDYLVIESEVIKVCYSYDFTGDSYFSAYADLIPDIAEYHGKDKYNRVVEFNWKLKRDINNVIMMDILVHNEDRHLRNLGILSDGNMCTLPYFDNGNSLFYNRSIKSIKEELKDSWKYQRCKPFYGTVGNQLKLIENEYEIKRIPKTFVYRIVNKYLKGERAKLVNKFLVESLRRHGLIEDI